MSLPKLKSRPYKNWFGEGDLVEDIAEAKKKYGEPLRVFVEREKYMAALIYADKVIITGYDDSEYQHNFELILEVRA